MSIRKKLSSFALVTGAGLLFGGCLQQDPVSVADSKPVSGTNTLATSAIIAPGTEVLNWSNVVGENPAIDIGCGQRVQKGVWMTGGSTTGRYPLWWWNGPGWTTFNRSWSKGPDGNEMLGVQIDVGANGYPWIVTSTNAIYSYDGTNWTYRGQGRDIGVGANGAVWRIEDSQIPGTSDYHISQWNGSGWNAAVNGGGVRIDVDPVGYPWIVNSAGDIWYMNDSHNFTQAQGLKGVDIGIGGTLGSVYVVSNEPYNSSGDFKVYHYTTTNTWKVTNGGGVRISVDYTTGKPWVVTNGGTAWASN